MLENWGHYHYLNKILDGHPLLERGYIILYSYFFLVKNVFLPVLKEIIFKEDLPNMRSFRVSYCRIQIWCNMKQPRRKGSGETCCYLCCDCLCRGGIYCCHLNSHCHGCDNHHYHHHSHYHYHQTRSLSSALFRLQKITKTEWEKIRQPTPNKKFLNFVIFLNTDSDLGGGGAENSIGIGFQCYHNIATMSFTKSFFSSIQITWKVLHYKVSWFP